MKEYPATIIELENGDVLATPVTYKKLSNHLINKKDVGFIGLMAAYVYSGDPDPIKLKLSEIHQKTIHISKIVTVREAIPTFVSIVDDTEDDE